MDEMTLVEQVFAEPEAGPDTVAAGRERLLRLAAEAPDRLAGKAPDRRARRSRSRAAVPAGPRARRARWVIGAALPAAAAVAATVVVLGGGPSGDGASNDSPARRALLVAAARSAAAPAEGRYARLALETGNVIQVGAGKGAYRMKDARVDEWWYPTGPGDDGWYRHQRLGARPQTPADGAAWRAAGSPSEVREHCPDEGEITGSHSVPGPGGGYVREPVRVKCRTATTRPRPAETERMTGGLGEFMKPPAGLDIGRLSPDPAELRGQLLAWTRGGGLAGPVEGDSAQLWAAVSTILFHPGGAVTPKVRAASYRVLADLPDVRSLGEVADPQGRRGQGLARTGKESEGVGGGAYRIIIDLRTGVPLAEETYAPGGGPLSDYSAVLRTEFTDQAPAPGG